MVAERGGRLLYREVQYFRQLWLWAIIVASSLVSFWGVVWQIILGRPFGNNPAPDSVLIVIAVVIGLGLPLFFYLANLTIEVRDDGVYFRFFPLHFSFRRIGLEDITSFEARRYRPIRDYGGWGIRYGRGGKAYNVSGDRGVQLELARGGRILLGSQHPEEMAEAIRAALGKR